MQLTVEEAIITEVARAPSAVTRRVCARLGITRQAVHRHIRRLIADGTLEAEGNTRSRRYRLRELASASAQSSLRDDLDSERLWRDHIHPALSEVSDNVRALCRYGFAECVNNAVAHSLGGKITAGATVTAAATRVWVVDNGIGVFNRLAAHLELGEQADAALELIKGRVTSAGESHRGDGLFIVAQLFDEMVFQSGQLELTRDSDGWRLESRGLKRRGTGVLMQVSTSSGRAITQVTEANTDYLAGRPYPVSLPLRLLDHEDRRLVSRAQARRLCRGLDRFREVELDFEGVAEVATPFVDELWKIASGAGAHLSFTRTAPAVKRLLESRR